MSDSRDSAPAPGPDETAAPGARRSRKAVFTPAVLRLLVLLGLGAAVFGVYLFTWVKSRETDFTMRDFRILAGLGKQIESIMKVQSEGLSRGALGATVEETAQQETELSISYRDAGTDEVRTSRVRLGSSAAREPEPRRAAPDEPRPPLLGFEAYPEGAYLETADPRNPRKLALEPLLTPLLARDVFDHIVVADGNGKILFAKDSREIRLASLAGLGAEPGGKDQAGGWLRGRQATMRIRDVDLSGTRYDLFISPLRVPVARAKENEGTSPWMVCGLVRSDRFRDESRALPRLPLIGFVALLVVLLLAWPLLKLKSMEGWEHLSRFDLVWLMVSLFLIPSLLTLALWGGWRFQGFSRMWDGTLREIADEIDRNFAAEVRAYEALLEDVDRAHAQPAPAVQVEEGAQGPAADPLAGEGELDRRLGRLPFLDVSWIRRDGCQVYKVNFGAPKMLINVADREYFRSLALDVRDVQPAAGGKRSLFLESVNSWTTGEPEMVMAVDRTYDPEVPVVSMAIPLVSLMDAVLPTGFSYAVVQNSLEVQGSRGNARRLEVGEVLLHSDKRRNLRENLLQETTDPDGLAALVAAREPRFETVVYQGEERRIYVRPLSVAGRPWSLVVLAESDIPSDFFLAVATKALVWASVYGLLVGLLFLSYSLVRGPRGFDWLWPRLDRVPAYTALAAFLLALILVYLFALTRLGSAQSLLFAALLPLAVLAGMHEAVGRRDESGSSQRIVTALVVLVLAGLAVLRAEQSMTEAVAGLLCAVVLAVLAAAAPEVGVWLGGRLDPLAQRLPAQPARWRWGFARPRWTHLACLVLGAVLLVVLPTVSFLNLAFDWQLSILVPQIQAELANRLEEKRKSLGRDLGDRFPLQEAATAGPQEASLEPTSSPALTASSTAGNGCEGVSATVPRRLPGALRSDLLLRMLEERIGLDEKYGYGQLLFDTCICQARADAPEGPRRTCSCREPSRRDAAVRGGGCQARSGARAIEARQATDAPGPAWRTRTVPESGGTCYELAGPAGDAGQSPLTISTRVSLGSLAPSDLRQALPFLLGFAAAAWISLVLLRFATGMLFFLGVGDREPEPAGSDDLLHLVLDRGELPPLADPPAGSGWRLFDLLDLGTPPHVSLSEDDHAVVVDHFDQAGPEADEARRLLLRASRGRRLVLLCDRIPNRALMPEPEALAADAPPVPLAVRQGDSLQLIRHRHDLEQRLRRDTTLLADVEILEQWLVYSGADQRKVLDLLGETLHAVFERKWASLDRPGDKGQEVSQEEKLLLRNLVRGQWITAKAGRRLQHLAAQGFVVQDPRLRIVGRSHGIFIREQTAREGELALHDQLSPWQRLKMPLAIGVVLLLGFLFLTQKNLLDNAVAMIGALGGGTAALLQFFSGIRGQSKERG